MTNDPETGTTPERPFRIAAYLTSKSLGDFVSQISFLHLVASQFDHSRVVLIYKENRDFKPAVVSLLPNAILMKLRETDTAILDLFSNNIDEDLYKKSPVWFNGRLHEQDFVLTDTVANIQSLSGFTYRQYLRVPHDLRDGLKQKLVQLGLNPDKWFCCIHYREPGYKYKGAGMNIRDSTPMNYWQLAEYVIDKLGGQVVRLGHPAMTRFPEKKGFCDLAAIEDTMLQIYAVSQARFMVAGPSGPSAVATAQNVPLGHTDAMDDWAPMHAHDAIRTVDVTTPTGELVNQQEYMKRGYNKLFFQKMIKEKQNYILQKNSGSELARMADLMFERTRNCQGWRGELPPHQPAEMRPNKLSWPMKPRRLYTFL